MFEEILKQRTSVYKNCRLTIEGYTDGDWLESIVDRSLA